MEIELEKEAREWVAETESHPSDFFAKRLTEAYLAGAEARERKLEAVRNKCGIIGDEWSCDVVDFANEILTILKSKESR